MLKNVNARPLSPEERAKVSDRIYYNDPIVALNAAKHARDLAHMERKGRLPPVFPTVQTKQATKTLPRNLREQLIAEGKIKVKS